MCHKRVDQIIKTIKIIFKIKIKSHILMHLKVVKG